MNPETTRTPAPYIALARKWRPTQFADLVGQEAVVRILNHALQSKRLHHAYLFTGSRGVGKTSIARIFAKALRCLHGKWEGNLFHSCENCSECSLINQGSSVDVIEIDGASNNGVDAIREIREFAKYLPASGEKKIYLIDEVHMLSTAAFNALLKTLEEPPPHVIFLFATTEPHKIPPTILSRCLRFDFKRVALPQMIQRLKWIAEHEGIKAAESALHALAQASEGSLRDALSLLDQVAAYGSEEITEATVQECLGLVGSEVLLGLLEAVCARNALSALALLDSVYARGHDIKTLSRDLIRWFHFLILAQVGAPRASARELTDSQWEKLLNMAKLRTLEETELLFQVLHQGLEWISHSPHPKHVLDVLLIKCATAEALVSLEDRRTNEAPSSPLVVNSQIQRPLPQVPQKKSEPLEPRGEPPAPLQSVSQQAIPAGPLSWEGLIEFIRVKRPLLASILEHGSANLELEQGSMTIAFLTKDSYFKEQLQSRTYTEPLKELTQAYFKKNLRISVIQSEAFAEESIALKKERVLQKHIQTTQDAIKRHPIVAEAQALFGGQLGPIELKSNSENSPHA